LTGASEPTCAAVESFSRFDGPPGLNEFRNRLGCAEISGFRVTGSKVCWIAVLMLATCVWAPSFGQTLRLANSQVGHDFWGFKEGSPGDVFALAQASDGFLWLGTATGLFRFDGTRFGRFHSPFGDQLLSTTVYSLFAPPTGGLWIGYAFGGFSFIKDGKVTNYGETGSATGSVREFAQDKDGIVWAATMHGLWRFDHSQWHEVGPELGLSSGPFIDVRFDREGTLWALAGNGDSSAEARLIFLRMGSRQFQTVRGHQFFPGFTRDADGYVATSPEDQHLFDSPGADAGDRPTAYPLLRKGCTIIVDRTGSVWISPPEPILLRLPRGDQPLSDVVAKAFPRNSESYELPAVYAKLVDREGNIWFGEQKGLHRFFYSPLTKQALPKSAEGSTLFTVTPDEDGAVWLNAGSDQLFNMYFIGHARVEARKAPGPLAGFAYRAPDKTTWFGGQAGLWHLVKGNLIRVDLPQEKSVQAYFLQAITQDPSGGMWISFGGHHLYRLADGVWTPNGGRNDLPKRPVTTEFTDSLGRVWFGYTRNNLAVLDGDRLQILGSSNGLRVGNVTAICGRGSAIWIGGEFGLQQFDHGRFHDIRTANEEWLRGISGIVETANGDLWLNGTGGIFHVRRSELSEALKNSTYQVKGAHLGRHENVPGPAFQVHPLNTAVEGTDGRIWFTGSAGVAWLDPNQSEEKVLAPPITIQSVSADDKSYQLASPLRFPAHTSSVQINYSAVSLFDPETIRFRYKLQETDKDWHEVSAAAPVSYRNLAPGSYHFSVNATDTSGAWSHKVATAEFTILPAFYQTGWFTALSVVSAMALVYMLYMLRMRQLARQYGMRERLLHLEAELAHVNRVSTLGEIAASLAHEIKQPIAAAITSANSCVEWLAHEPPNLDRARAAAARIDKYGHRAAEIIDHIRSFYRKSPPQREWVDVNGIIQEMLTLLKGEATRFSIAMRTDLSTELPETKADRVQLQQVFMNLILNGIEAMVDSGGELSVKSELQDGQLQFSVSDTGVGLPKEKMDQIFSAFFTTKPQGSGMGLAISRSIVESHGGQLWASANSGRGATFHFTLPIQVTESSPLVA